MQQIANWLELLGLGEYAQRLADNNIDASVLRDLTDHDLEKIGVSLGHRRKMLRAIAELDGAVLADKAVAEQPRQNDAERRHLTVMFCDLVGSTGLSSRLDPEELRDIIGAYHRRCAEVIVKSGGFVAKYMGDGVLAYFGYPQAHEDDAERAVRAGLALVEGVAKLDAGAGTAMRVRIGIATGLVVVGDLLGEGAAQERAVVGETPNLAARLQGLAEPSTVVIGGDTHRLLGKLFEYRALGPMSVKGFGDPVLVWQVLGEGATDSRFEALRAPAWTPLIGREEELNVLLRRWLEVKQNEGKVVLVSGEPGIGKSRLIAEFEGQLRGEKHTRLRYFCSTLYQDSPLYPVIGQFEHTGHFERDDTPAERLRKLRAVVAPAAPPEQDIALFAELLSIQADGLSMPNVGPQRKKEMTFAALTRRVERLARTEPVLIVLEDAHWCDPTTLELVELTIDLLANLPVMLVISFRPEFEAPWIGRAGVDLITLARLDREQAATMVARVANADKLLMDLVERIAARADGVPLFIEELTKTILEQGHDRLGGVELGVPDTLQGSLMSRLDRFPAAKQVAQIAAVIGREFRHDLLAAVTSIPAPILNEGLAQLVRSGLVFRRGEPPETLYIFKHALVQESAYESLLSTRRLETHLSVADEIERRSANRLVEVAEVLAHHYSGARCCDKAFRYLFLAGRKSLGIYSLWEAEQYFRKALRLLDVEPACADDRAVADAVTDVLQVIFLKSDIPEARRIVERYLPRIEAMGDTPQLPVVLYFQALMLTQMADFRAGEALAQRAMEIASRVGDLKAMTYARVCVLGCSTALGGCSTGLGSLSLERAEELAAQALAQCKEADDGFIQSSVYFNMAVHYSSRGLMTHARDWCQKLIDAGRERGDLRALGTANWLTSWFDIVEERYDEALTHAQECLQGATTPLDRNVAAMAKATAKILSGRVDEGLSELEEARHWALSHGLLLFESNTHGGLAAALAFTGRIAQAVRLLTSSIATNDAAGNRLAGRRNRIILAEIYLAMLSGSQIPPFRVIVKNFRTIVGAKMFGIRRVRSLLEQAGRDEWISAQGVLRARIDMDLGLLYKLKKKPGLAREFLNKARSAAEAQNAEVMLSKINAVFDELSS